jgi:ABC-type phosphate transport system substrate-binding protein
MRGRWAAAGLMAVAVAAARPALAGDVAIIVNRAHGQDQITMKELERIFRLDQQRWRSGDKVELVLQVSASDKEAVVHDRIYHMGAEELRKYWLGKVFRGELTAAPRAFSSDASVKTFVAGNAQAIGYIDSVLLDDTVKVLSIDGKRPGEAGYALARTVN